jgi:superfamily II DNA/RNA helicase
VIVYCNRQYLTEEIAEKLTKDLQSLKPVDSSNSGTEDEENDSLASNSTSKKRYSTDSSVSKQRRVEWNVGYYHGDVEPDERDKVHKDFMEGKIHVMVATEAFGVGLNKKDVRAIIHYDIPKSIELYVQELGRAGRDDETAYCHAFVDDEVSNIHA